MVNAAAKGRRRAATPEVPGMPGVDPRISRTVEVRDHAGELRRWHLLDSGPLLAERGITPQGTLLAVHGNPTYSFLFRSLVREDIPWRLIAVDQLEMGWSERTGTNRRLQDRITDLSLLTDALSVRGPVVTVGHDWGGIVSVGWALDNRHDLAGMILTNTGIHQELGEKLPKALQLATAPAFLPASTSLTDGFLRTTLALSRPPLPARSRTPISRRTGPVRAARASSTSSPTSRPRRRTPRAPRSSGSLPASAISRSPRSWPGARATSPSRTAICAI